MFHAEIYINKSQDKYYKITLTKQTIQANSKITIMLDKKCVGYYEIKLNTETPTLTYRHTILLFSADYPYLLDGETNAAALEIKADSKVIFNAQLLNDSDLHIEGTVVELYRKIETTNISIQTTEKLIIYQPIEVQQNIIIATPACLIHDKVLAKEKISIKTAYLVINSESYIHAINNLKLITRNFKHMGHLTAGKVALISTSVLDDAGSMQLPSDTYIHADKWIYRSNARVKFIHAEAEAVSDRTHILINKSLVIQKDAECKFKKIKVHIDTIENLGTFKAFFSDITGNYFFDDNFSAFYQCTAKFSKRIDSSEQGNLAVFFSKIYGNLAVLKGQTILRQGKLNLLTLELDNQFDMAKSKFKAQKVFFQPATKAKIAAFSRFNILNYLETQPGSVISIIDSDLVGTRIRHQGELTAVNGLLDINALDSQGTLNLERHTNLNSKKMQIATKMAQFFDCIVEAEDFTVKHAVNFDKTECKIKETWAVDPAVIVQLTQSYLSSARAFIYGKIVLQQCTRIEIDSLFSEKNSIIEAKGKSFIQAKQILFSVATATQHFDKDAMVEGGLGYFKGSVKAQHARLQFQELGFLSTVHLDNTFVHATKSVLWGTKSKATLINSTKAVAKKQSLAGQLSIQQGKLEGASLTLHQSSKTKITDKSSFNAIKKIEVLGKLSAEQSAVIAKDIHIYKKLKANQALLKAKKSIQVGVTATLDAQESLLQASTIDNCCQINSKGSIFDASKTMTNHFAAQLQVISHIPEGQEKETPTVIKGRTLINDLGAEITGDGSLYVDNQRILNMGNMMIDGDLALHTRYLMNIFSATSARNINIISKYMVLNLLNAIHAQKNASVLATVSLNAGILHARDVWLENAILSLNAGIKSSYNVIDNAVFYYQAGLILPSIPTWNGFCSVPKALGLLRTIARTFLPSWGHTISAGVGSLQLMYSLAPLLKDGVQKIYDIHNADDGNGWDKEFQKIRTWDYWLQALPTIMRAKGVITAGIDLAFNVDDAFTEIKEGSLEQLQFDISHLSYMDLAMGSIGMLLPSYSNTAFLSQNDGLELSGSIHHDAFVWRNRGVVQGLFITGDIEYMSNQGLLSGYRYYFEGAELNNEGYILNYDPNCFNYKVINYGHEKSSHVHTHDGPELDGMIEAVQVYDNVRVEVTPRGNLPDSQSQRDKNQTHGHSDKEQAPQDPHNTNRLPVGKIPNTNGIKPHVVVVPPSARAAERRINMAHRKTARQEAFKHKLEKYIDEYKPPVHHANIAPMHVASSHINYVVCSLFAGSLMNFCVNEFMLMQHEKNIKKFSQLNQQWQSRFFSLKKDYQIKELREKNIQKMLSFKIDLMEFFSQASISQTISKNLPPIEVEKFKRNLSLLLSGIEEILQNQTDFMAAKIALQNHYESILDGSGVKIPEQCLTLLKDIIKTNEIIHYKEERIRFQTVCDDQKILTSLKKAKKLSTIHVEQVEATADSVAHF